MVSVRCGVLIAFAVALTAAPATAADAWLAANVRGTVLMQLGSQWTEIENGDSVANGLPVRTLQAGRVELRRRAEVLQLAPNTVIRPNDTGSMVTVEQYAGQLTLIESRGRKYQLVTPSFTASTGGASVVSSIVGGKATLVVQHGRVPVRIKGRNLLLVSGQTISSGAGNAVTVTGQSGAVPATTPPGTDIGGQPDVGGTKIDNGIGNGGIPGNGGQNGNAGGNGNPGKGNAGGDDDSQN